MNERLLCELLPYLNQYITLSLNKIINSKREADLIEQLAHGWENNSIWNNFKLCKTNDIGNFMPGKFRYYTWKSLLEFHINSSVSLSHQTTECSWTSIFHSLLSECCSGVSLVAVRSVSKVKKGTQRPYNLSPVKLNCLILRRELCQGSHPH